MIDLSQRALLQPLKALRDLTGKDCVSCAGITPTRIKSREDYFFNHGEDTIKMERLKYKYFSWKSVNVKWEIYQ